MPFPFPFRCSPSRGFIAAGLWLALCGLVAPSSAQTYAVTDLGVLAGGTYSDAAGINNSGQIVGSSSSASSGNSATLWSVDLAGGVTRTDLGTGGYRGSFAQGINDAGQIVGYLTSGFNPDGVLPAPRAVLFSVGAGGVANAPRDLGALPGQAGSQAYAINQAGQVAGLSLTFANSFGGTPTLTTLESGGPVVKRLGPSGVAGSAYAINSAGLVVGEYFASGSVRHVDLTPSSTSSRALGINASGQIVGSGAANGLIRPMLFTSANGVVTQTDLGVPAGFSYGEASAINSSGQIVGTAGVLNGVSSRAVLYTAPGGARVLGDLVVPGSGVSEIDLGPTGNRINDWGQIVGRGTVAGQSHALLLNPTTPLSSASGAAQNTRLVAGMSYALSPGFRNATLGSLGSTVVFRDGTAGSAGLRTFGLNRSLDVAFAPPAGGSPLPQLRASDVVSVQGAGGDRFVLQLSYDSALAAALTAGDALGARLGWLDPTDGAWKLAVLGNGDGGAGASFAGDRAYNGSTDFQLGRFGVDSANHVVWAVLDHEGTFAVVPEPSPWTLLISAGVLAAGLARRWGRHAGGSEARAGALP